MAAVLLNFDDSSLRTELERAGFYLAAEPVDLGNGCRLPVAAFSHRPFDTRTACFAAIPPGDDEVEQVGRCIRFGAPLIGVGSGVKWRIYHLTQGGPQIWWDFEHGPVSRFFKEHRDEIKPRAIFRAKTLAQLDKGSQLEFVDFAAFRRIEEDAGANLTRLIHEMVAATRESLGWPTRLDERKAQWIARANFWLLAGRILHDKRVPGFIKNFDLSEIADVFGRVRKHYADQSQPDELPKNRIKALQEAAKILKANPSLAIVSPETLAHPFENALITRETRKESGTHSTPGWLVEYMLGRLRPWIEKLASAGRCRVFEPASGHAPFLLGAMRTFASLPCCDGLDDKARHTFFKNNLEGCEYDGFAREVARLSLTLADVPNPNGWNLGDETDGDLFFGDRLERGVKNADIVLCNPPFEAEKSADNSGDDLARVKKAAEILRRCAAAAKPGAVFGFVVPQTMLDSHKLVDLRNSLVRDFEWLEICRLPDGIFEKADVETALLLGRRHPAGELKLTVGPTSFRHVLDGDRYRTEFRKYFTTTTEQPLPLARVAPAPDHSLWVPDMLDVWDAMAELPKLGDVASVGQGFIFRSESDPKFPKGETQISEKPRKGYSPGFFGARDLPNTHDLPNTILVNRSGDAIRRPVAGFKSGGSRLVMNYAPVRRGPWRNQAFIDSAGHPTSSRFLVVTALAGSVGDEFLWAVLNSPIGNAFTGANCDKRQILAKKLEGMRLPKPTPEQHTRIESAARAYREAAEQWTKDHPQAAKPKSLNAKSEDVAEPDFFATEQEAKQQQLLALKYLHWRIDAEVLALYNLPAHLERQLLDYFTGERRVGVPFEQTEYFPKGFKGMNRLSELLTITADWPKHSKRRAFLIKKEYEHGSLSAKEEAELESLQRLASLHRNYFTPIDRSELDASIKRLKLLGQWDE
jgi:hypothetical protein